MIQFVKRLIFTEYYRCAGDDPDQKKPTLEAHIVRHAAMLDALWAVGITWVFMFGGFLGEPMWAPDGVNTKNAKMFSHGKTSSIVHRFHEKLLKLEDKMTTDQGRMLATDGTHYMRKFLDVLMTDIT